MLNPQFDDYKSQYPKAPKPLEESHKGESLSKYKDWDRVSTNVRSQKPLPPQVVTLESLFPRLDRWAIGFDDMFDTLTAMSKAKTVTYPPYNLTKFDNGRWSIELALAGFRREDIEIKVEDRTLTVSSDVNEPEESFGEVIHHGIAQRNFKQEFAMAEYVEIEEAKLEDGILTINLVTNIPEEKKPKIIEIR